eukprot:COSAG01_NODE_1956_length_8813_cov_9.237434_4_plen_57_part_00
MTPRPAMVVEVAAAADSAKPVRIPEPAVHEFATQVAPLSVAELVPAFSVQLVVPTR